MICAAVLAGGRSSRMGQDKSRLMLGGTSLLERTVNLLAASGADEILISGTGPTLQYVPDLLPHSGPPGAVYSLLQHFQTAGRLQGQALLLVPVDMPLLRAATLQHLLASADGQSCCHYAGEVFPCVLPASAALLTHMAGIFADSSVPGGQRSMRAIMRWLEAVEIPVPKGSAMEFRNVNTPEDWQQIIALLQP